MKKLLAISVAILLISFCNTQTVVNYSYTSALQSWTVPVGITEATIIELVAEVPGIMDMVAQMAHPLA